MILRVDTDLPTILGKNTSLERLFLSGFAIEVLAARSAGCGVLVPEHFPRTQLWHQEGDILK
jgi:hypothetical protein